MDWLDLFDINLSLADERTPLYRRIVDAISGAIESGKLKAGDKLPTNRELASKLKIDIGNFFFFDARVFCFGTLLGIYGRFFEY